MLNNQNQTFTYVSPTDFISLYDENTSFMKIDEIDRELNAIFQTPDKLSKIKQIECNNYLREIDKIYIKNSSNLIDEIYSEIDFLYTRDKTDELTISLLQKQLDDLFFDNSISKITAEDEKNLSLLNSKIDALYNEKELTIDELYNAKMLFNEKEKLFAGVFVQRSLQELR